MMASGIKWNETYTDPSSDRRKLLELQIASNKQGAIFDVVTNYFNDANMPAEQAAQRMVSAAQAAAF